MKSTEKMLLILVCFIFVFLYVFFSSRSALTSFKVIWRLFFYGGNHLVFVFSTVNFILTAGISTEFASNKWERAEKNVSKTKSFIYFTPPTRKKKCTRKQICLFPNRAKTKFYLSFFRWNGYVMICHLNTKWTCKRLWLEKLTWPTMRTKRKHQHYEKLLFIY